ncbi:hypothetical protein BDV09DRAFT_184728 [Aspergillus tetrazonus]
MHKANLGYKMESTPPSAGLTSSSPTLATPYVRLELELLDCAPGNGTHGFSLSIVGSSTAEFSLAPPLQHLDGLPALSLFDLLTMARVATGLISRSQLARAVYNANQHQLNWKAECRYSSFRPDEMEAARHPTENYLPNVDMGKHPFSGAR